MDAIDRIEAGHDTEKGGKLSLTERPDVLTGLNDAQQLEKYLRVGWRASKVIQRTVYSSHRGTTVLGTSYQGKARGWTYHQTLQTGVCGRTLS